MPMNAHIRHFSLNITIVYNNEDLLIILYKGDMKRTCHRGMRHLEPKSFSNDSKSPFFV